MSELKTKPNDISAEAFINALENDTKKHDGLELLAIFFAVTGEKPKMWGSSIVGFGQYHYKSEKSRQEGDWPLVAFSPRKQNLSLYLTTGHDQYAELLQKLGKHKTSKGCLYIGKLADVDISVLGKLIGEAYADAKRSLT